MTIQWYPGQMAKARKHLTKMVRLIDLMVEVRDARIPESSRNPEIHELVGVKQRLVVLNKEDLAERELTSIWVEHLTTRQVGAVSVSTLQGRGMEKALGFISSFKREKLRRVSRNIPLRIMVVGIPNVGKSSFINRLSGRRAANTGDRPGITRGEQWVRVREGIELLDTIGLLWPKFDSPEVAFKLAITGAIKYELLDDYALAVKLLEYLREKGPQRLEARYRVLPEAEETAEELLQAIGRSRGMVKRGGDIDLERTAEHLLVEFRQGKLGRFTLDVPLLT